MNLSHLIILAIQFANMVISPKKKGSVEILHFFVFLFNCLNEGKKFPIAANYCKY